MIGLIFHLCLTSQYSFFGIDPSLEWKTLETPHFYIHYESRKQEAATRLSSRVEPVYQKVTKLFSWEPADKTHVVVLDNTDESNGLSTPLPYNTIYLLVTPPLDGSTLDSYDDWLGLLFTHEFTHTVHIDMARGLAKVPRAVLGRFFLPNAVEPQWLIEGLAEFNETELTRSGRGRSSFIESYLRTVTMEDKFLPIERASYWNDKYPFGNAAYWYGIGFHNFLKRRYGSQKIYDFANENSSRLYLAFTNFKSARVFGKSFHRLWAEWRGELGENWKKLQSQYEPKAIGEKLLKDETVRLQGQPIVSADGKSLYAALTVNRISQIASIDLQKTEPEIKKLVMGKRPQTLSLKDGVLFYADIEGISRFDSASDLFAYNIEKDKEQKLTRGLHLRDPFVVGENIYAVRTKDIKSEIVRFKIPQNIFAEEPKFKPLTSLQAEILYQAEGYDTVSKPTVLRDQSKLYFSMKREWGFRDLYELDLATQKLTRLTKDAYQDLDPVLTENGDSFYFSSDRPLGTTGVPVQNLFELNPQTRSLHELTDSWSGTRWTTASPSEIYFGYFRWDGYELRHIKKSALLQRERALTNEEETRVPPDQTEIKAEPTDYTTKGTLWPHYLLPFFFFTESDTAIGAQTGSNDPLTRHDWHGLAYHLFSPNRPGGFLGYSYNGFASVSLFVGAVAGINLNTSTLYVSPYLEDYYERFYEGYVGYGFRFLDDGVPGKFRWNQNFFFDRQESLLGFPAGTLSSGTGNVTLNGKTYRDVIFRPEEGNSWGTRATLSWTNPSRQTQDGITPFTGQIVSLGGEYTVPKSLKSDFQQLTTTLNAKAYFGLPYDQGLAATATVGAQWLKALYQRSFRLGGSFGEGPFSSINRRYFPLRGLDAGVLRGEAITAGSLEYRFPLFRNLPGWGTAPVWFKNFHGALFSDFGQAFQFQNERSLAEVLVQDATGRDPVKNFSLKRFSVSSGAEIRTDMSALYAPPLTFRFGYGYVLYTLGEWIGDQKEAQFYAQLGTSF